MQLKSKSLSTSQMYTPNIFFKILIISEDPNIVKVQYTTVAYLGFWFAGIWLNTPVYTAEPSPVTYR